MRKYILFGLCGILSASTVQAQETMDLVCGDTLDNRSVFTIAYSSCEDTSANTFFRMYQINARQVRTSQGGVQVSVDSREQGIMRDIQSQRVAYFTDAMELTPEEAQDFWPLYNQMIGKRNKLLEDKKAIIRNCTEQRIAAMTPTDAEGLGDKLISLQQQEGDLLAEYHKKFKTVLSAKKMLLMYKADKDFMQALLLNLRRPVRMDPSDM